MEKIFRYENGKLYRISTNKEVGTTVHGYRRVKVNYKTYAVHRIIWELHYGEIPNKMQIDHIDHDRLNNKLSNLRLVEQKDNLLNKSLYKTSSSGISGINFVKNLKKWKVIMQKDKKRIYLGVFEDFEEAIEVRKNFIKKGEFHENHGN